MALEESPVILELASRVGRDDLFEWIEEEARRLARLGRATDGTVRVGRALQRACHVAEVVPSRISARAELRVGGDEFWIAFNPMLSVDVQRFAIAHEIGHTLWMERVPGGSPRNWHATVGSSSGTIEMLCDYFAAALLMPRDDVEHVLLHHRESRVKGRSSSEAERCPLELVPDLARRFRVQRRIAAWRLLLVRKLTSWTIVRVQNALARSSGPLLASQHVGDEAWETAWYAAGTVERKVSVVEGYRVPFDTRRRRIPTEMVPGGLASEGRLQKLDSRWWDGVMAEPAASASLPFRRRERKTELPGLAARIGDSVYVALDRGRRTEVALECRE